MRETVRASDVLSDRYVLERELGRGGMGVVFLARDLKYDREVAVKLLTAEATEGVGADRFLAEIRTAARLNHAHILAVHDSGEDSGRLYYVMPRVEGESLRQRLERESRLSLADTVRIARHVANALDYAHARGYVHRDVKPENILLDRGGHAWLADFGVARALSVAASTQRTVDGVLLGSPLYMSPEQSAGKAHSADGRSDVYSLGCVVFEMLAGEPPFGGETMRAVLVRHLTERPPSLRARRADVPPAFDSAVRMALAKSADERYSSAEAFARALDTAAGIRHSRWRWRLPHWMRSRTAGFGLAGLGAVSIALLASPTGGSLVRRIARLSGPELDPMRLVVLPLRSDDGTPAVEDELARLRHAVSRWRDLDVMDGPSVLDALDNRNPDDISNEDALDVARLLGAGRYLHGARTLIADSIQLDVGLHDAVNDGRTLARVIVQFASATEPPATLLALLVDSLLFGRVTWDDGPHDDIGTRSYTARLAYGAAHAALDQRDLPRAESLFVATTLDDPDFARAQLWLAQVRNWTADEPDAWATAAELALRGLDQLSPRERLLASGLLLLARQSFSAACAVYDSLRERDPRDFAGWYGRGECHALDKVVVPDAASPGGWSFRSSYHQAVEAYLRAFELLPVSHRGFSAAMSERIQRILFTRSNRISWGVSSDGTRRFSGWPVWQGDTLTLLPYPAPGTPYAGRPPGDATDRAIVQHRRMFHDIAIRWSRASPSDPEALYALALSQELMGDPSVVDVLARARRLPSEPRLGLRLAALEVWMAVKFSLPGDPARLRAAAVLADSLVAHTTPRNADDALILAELASLIGRPAAAARFARLAARVETAAVTVPVPFIALRDALLAFAAAGASRDSLELLERQAEEMIRRSVPRSDRPAVRALHLELAAILAYPHHRFAILDEREAQSPIAAALGALSRDDTASARAIVESMRNMLPPTAMTIDMHYAMAHLIATLGDTAASIRWLDAGLDGIRWADPGVLDDIVKAGVLARAVALRASLAAASFDTLGTRRWTTAVSSLRAHAEPWPETTNAYLNHR